MKPPGLKPKQLAFVEHYLASGNASDAARKAGYTGDERTINVTGSRMLTNAKVQEAIKARAKPPSTKRIADAEAIRNFWTEMLNDQKADPKDRLKASELLGKTMGIFLEKKMVDGKLEITVRRGNDAAGALPPKEAD